MSYVAYHPMTRISVAYCRLGVWSTSKMTVPPYHSSIVSCLSHFPDFSDLQPINWEEILTLPGNWGVAKMAISEWPGLHLALGVMYAWDSQSKPELVRHSIRLGVRKISLCTRVSNVQIVLIRTVNNRQHFNKWLHLTSSLKHCKKSSTNGIISDA